MQKLTPADLHTLESYAKLRGEFRASVLEHKKPRRVAIGPNANFYFEDRLTMQYQVQEMLRIERIFEEEGIMEELGAYNPLIPDGSNWKATFMLEYSDVDQRRAELAKLVGVEDKVWVQVDGFEQSFGIANEDLERSTDEKTSSVHFMRFEFTPEMVAAIKSGSAVAMGIDHPAFEHGPISLSEDTRQALAADFE